MADISKKEQTNLMTNITINKRTAVVTDIMEHATVTNNSTEHADIMYVITEQYRTCNQNDKHYGTTVMMYIMALN